MRKMTEDSIGIDVSKLWLDAHRLSTAEAVRFANDRDGHTALLHWIAAAKRARVVFEPTGRYHREMERRLAAADLPLVKVNPRHARRFCEALGARAKTDRADARRCSLGWAPPWRWSRGRDRAKACAISTICSPPGAP